MTATLLHGDCLEQLRALPDNSVDAVVTSPPYWNLRDYAHAGQIGIEKTADLYIDAITSVLSEIRRILKQNGTAWINLGDTYFKSQLQGIPWRVAFSAQRIGWFLRQDIIWSKPNPMPEAVKNRCTKSHEYLFLLTKSADYYYDPESIREPNSPTSHPGTYKTKHKLGSMAQRAEQGFIPGKHCSNKDGRNKRSVWTITVEHSNIPHVSLMPQKLVEPCILAGCPVGGVVLDPFAGSGTTGVVAIKHGRRFIGCEINGRYIEIARARIAAAENERAQELPFGPVCEQDNLECESCQ